jgi:hypothetical protein
MTTTFESLEALVPDFQYVDDEHDCIVLTVGLQATFYFWGGHRPDVRTSIADCAQAYEAEYGGELRWLLQPDTQRRVDLNDGNPLSLRDYIATLDEDDSIEWYVSSSETDESVGEYRYEIVTERGWQEGVISTFSFTVPREHAFDADSKSRFVRLFEFIADRLAPYHAHAGLAAVTSFEQEDWQSEELDVATRYQGLYIEANFIDANYAPDGLKSVDWLTYIGNILAERVGGIDRLSSSLQARAIAIKQLRAGLLIASGKCPDIGQVENGLPPALVDINRAVRPLRNGAFGSMAFGSASGEPRFTRCTSDLWIRRFDAEGIWPPATFVGLGKEPFGRSPSRKIRLKTGDTSPIYGRYRRLDAEKPEIVLMAGDVAPYWLSLGPHGELLSRDAVVWELAAEL